jgi:hypothetical protein
MKAVQLYNDESDWFNKQQKGFQIINTRFNKTEFQQKFMSIINQTIQQLNQNRLNNFTGQMLMHHTLQSTKFMSKWISEKNKKETI